MSTQPPRAPSTDTLLEEQADRAGRLAPQPKADKAIQGRTPLQLAWIRLRRDKVAMASLVVIILLILFAIFAPLVAKLTGHGPNTQYRSTGLSPDGVPVGPGGNFWLGTDDLGRDILVRLAYGARISLTVGLIATAIAVIIGVVVGLVAGYFGGKVDTALSRLMDIVLSFPLLVFAIALVALFGQSLYLVIGVIAFFSWSTIGRIVRGQVLSVREKEYVEAARSLGAGDTRIMFVDVLPNLIAPVIVYSTLLIPTAIVFEATLSFLGLGVVPPTASWGAMLNDATQWYTLKPIFFLAPSMALLLTTLAFNLLGDGLRDALDPRAERTMAK